MINAIAVLKTIKVRKSGKIEMLQINFVQCFHTLEECNYKWKNMAILNKIALRKVLTNLDISFVCLICLNH